MPVERFLKQRAVSIMAEGHYTLQNWYDPEGKLRTFPCKTIRVSPFRMIVDVPVTGKVGDTLTSYFKEFGQLDGHISDTRPGCFLLELEMTYANREKLANKLNWLEEKTARSRTAGAAPGSAHHPAQQRSIVTLADGAVHECTIIDMSVSGAAVTAPLQPEVGTALAIGACVGRVVRHLPGGFAIQFVDRYRAVDLERLLARPLAPSFAAIAEPALSET